MAWLFLALAGAAGYAALAVRPADTGPQLDRKRLRGIERGRAQQRREHEARCGKGCKH